MRNFVPDLNKKHNRWLLFIVLSILAISILTWLSYVFIIPIFDYPNKDFMTFWTGSRALLEGIDLYNDQLWEPLRARYGSSWMPNATAPYPLWTFILTLPFAFFSVEWGAALWLAVSEVLLAICLYGLVYHVFQYRPTINETILLFVVAFASITNLLIIINGQFTYFLLAIFTLFLLLLQRKRPFLAGVVLSLVVLKPNLFILFMPLFALWLLLRRRWHTIGGGVTGLAGLLAISWMILPGWIADWTAVRSKTAVVTVTPTVWGAAHDLFGSDWFIGGIMFAILVTIGVGWYVFTHKDLSDVAVFSLALAASFLVTPYMWTYEHALLLIPWLWSFALIRPRKLAQQLLLLIAFILPWVMFAIAVIRLQESLTFVVPLVTIALIIFTQKRFAAVPEVG